MHVFEAVLLCLVVAGWTHWLVSAYYVRRQFASHARADASFMPPVSILKPLKGLDANLYQNLKSFCRQEYPCFELLLGMRDADDPAMKVVRRLQRQFPHCAVRAFIAPDLGANPKSAILHELVQRANYKLLVISDSDIQVGRDYLRRVVAPLHDPSIGMVTCLYRSKCSDTLAAALGGLHVDLSFVPSATLGSHLPGVCYAFGATLAMRRDQLIAAGGYAAIADHLADDFQVCVNLQQSGLRIRLSDYLVTHGGGDDSLPAFWRRHLRWARTVRACAPLQYLGMIFTLSTPCAVALLVVTRFAAWAWGILLASLLLRWIIGWKICGWMSNRGLRRQLPWLPLSDCLDGLIWFTGLFGRRITWRGATYRLHPDGRLSEIGDGRWYDPAASFARGLVRRLDARLRRSQGIFEYSNDPHCIFRAEVAKANQEIVLDDGVCISPGDRVLELHLWNEHIPAVQRSAMMAWSRATSRRVVRSLVLLRGFLESRQDLHDVKAVRARTAFMPRSEKQLRRLVERFGFEFHGPTPMSTLGAKLHRAGENLLIWALIWTFNSSANLRALSGRPRYEVWMSRRMLRSHYGRKTARRTTAMVERQPWSTSKPSARKINARLPGE